MKKILIVEDDPMLSEIYQKKFTQSDFEVVIATSGLEAEEKAVTEKPDLMLLDLVLPEVDGFDVLKKVKDDPDTRHIKVMVFSNLSQQEDREKARSMGADGFIAKSDVTPQQIVEEVKKVLSIESGEKKGGPELEKSAVEKQAKNARHQSAHILLVEDEEVFVEVFGKKLESEGYQVDVAKNGAWAIDRIKKVRYDMILADVLMPELNGIEVIRMTKQEGKNKKTPIIVISNSIEDHQVEEILQAGAQEVLIKTRVTPSELAVRVRQVLS